jgi:small-conductance mechanosensitive channel
MNEIIQRIQSWALIIGPNKYLQALTIAVMFIVIGKAAELILTSMIGKFAKRTKTDMDDRLVVLLHKPIFMTFVLVGLAMSTRRLSLPEPVEFITLGILRTIAIGVWYNLLHKVTTVIANSARSRKSSKIAQTGMLQLLQNVVKVVLFTLAVYFIFLAWEINVTAWVASAGIVGLAISFAAKDTLSNLFAGVSIVMDAPYKTGDFINLDSGERGMVTMIGLRSTRILTRDDIEITIPNGIIGNSKIVNEAGGPSQQHRITLKVGVAYGSDIDHTIATLQRVAAGIDGISSTPEARVRFREFGDWSLNLELQCWIGRPVDRGRISHELHCAVYKAFAENDIVIPVPTHDIRMSSNPTSLPDDDAAHREQN